MGIKAPFCKFCETVHWSYEGHAGLRASGSVVKRSPVSRATREKGLHPQEREDGVGSEVQTSPQAQGSKRGAVAQRRERRVVNPEVAGSSPVGPATCKICGESLSNLRAGAKTCSLKCRVALSRRK